MDRVYAALKAIGAPVSPPLLLQAIAPNPSGLPMTLSELATLLNYMHNLSIQSDPNQRVLVRTPNPDPEAARRVGHGKPWLYMAGPESPWERRERIRRSRLATHCRMCGQELSEAAKARRVAKARGSERTGRADPND